MNGNKLSRGQLICIKTLITKLSLQAQGADMVNGFSNGRTDSTKDLTPQEATDMIRHLKSLDPEEKKAEVMRKKIIAIAHEMNWHKKGTHDVDMQRIDGWCVTYGRFKKKLNQHTYSQLPALLTQFKTVYDSYLLSL